MFLVLTWQTQKTNIYYECTLTKIFTYRLYMLYNFFYFFFQVVQQGGANRDARIT